MKTLFVTGATGFLANALIVHFNKHGFKIHGSSHDINRLASCSNMMVTSHVINFNTPVSPAVFQGCDAVIHCALDNTPGSMEKNISGTMRIFEAAEKSGVSSQIFVSSHSARPDAYSEYGITKYRLENQFISRGKTVVRPGLIIGNGGLFLKNYHQIAKLWCVPFFDGGKAPVAVVTVKDLCIALQQIVEFNLKGGFNLFYSYAPTMKDITEKFIEISGNKPWRINIPTKWTSSLNDLMNLMGIPCPNSLSRLKTMQLNLESPVHESHIKNFFAVEPTFEEIMFEINKIIDAEDI